MAKKKQEVKETNHNHFILSDKRYNEINQAITYLATKDIRPWLDAGDRCVYDYIYRSEKIRVESSGWRLLNDYAKRKQNYLWLERLRPGDHFNKYLGMK